MKKKMKCKICGYRFVLKKKDVYRASECITVVQALSTTPKHFDMVDCPECGCQIRLCERLIADTNLKNCEPVNEGENDG